MSPSLPAHRWPSLGLLGLIQVYKWTLSPIVGRQCRYAPTCSSYAADAVRKHGAWAGSWMAAARICRCAPWGGHGYDPAPEMLSSRAYWWTPWRYGVWRTHSSPLVGEVSPKATEGGRAEQSALLPLAPYPDRPPPPAPSPQGGGGRKT